MDSSSDFQTDFGASEDNNTGLNQIEKPEKEEKERRPVLGLLLMLGLLLILCAAGAFFGPQLLGGNAETVDSGLAIPTEEPLTSTNTATNTNTSEPSDEPTTVTDTPTATATHTSTPTDTPTPTRGALPDPTTAVPVADPCADHGGLQYEGDTCICPGVIDHVIICVDGTKFDNVTTVSCEPDAVCTEDPGGGSGDPSCKPTWKRCACDYSTAEMVCIDSCGNTTRKPDRACIFG
jgi:hypothetical protein